MNSRLLPLTALLTLALPACSAATTPQADAFMRGVDVSEARDAERSGVQFRDLDGQVKPALQIIRDHRYDWVRVRLMIDPDGRYGLTQDLPYVKAVMLDAQKHNLKVLLDLHYSHWWADPGGQWLPDRWKGQDTATLSASVYDYTRGVMNELKAQGTPPDMVQVGNEINGGMLWEPGRIRNDDMTTFAALANAGTRAVHDAQPGTPVMIHIAKIGDADDTASWYRAFAKAGGQFDTIGLSYYPMWHGTFEDLGDSIRKLKTAFGKPVIVAETALYWDTNEKGYDNVPYPQTRQGQLDYLRALTPVVRQAGGSGLFYWGAFWSQSSRWLKADWTDDDASRRSLFDDDARATPAIDGLN
ncbi:glycoside hydrolase family 53 protein [Deinococcus sp. ME38]|uniref:glycoside hydrolase family 53 protein n=1 Tax=Deinococcus sp. ME38 TaxID=3400344 RepID=UPI003B5C2BE6